MNCEEIVLPPVEVKRFQTEPALQCLLHTIIFNRSLHSKNLRPRDADCDIFDISYAQSDNKEVARKVTEGIRNFLKKMDETKIDKGTFGKIRKIEVSYIYTIFDTFRFATKNRIFSQA